MKKNKTFGFYCNLIAAAFAIVSIAAYSVAGQDSYGFVPLVVILLGLGVLSALFFGWHDFLSLGPVITMLFMGAGLGVFLNSRFMYYAHQYYGIASDPISGAMIVTTIALAGMILFEMISAFFLWEEGR